MLSAPLRRSVHIEIIQRTIREFRDAHNAAAIISPFSLRSRPVQLECFDWIRITPCRAPIQLSPLAYDHFNPRHAQTLVSSSPYITFHIAFRNSSLQHPPASDNIHLSIIPCGLDERNQSIVVYIQDRADVRSTEYFAPKITICGTAAVKVRSSLSSLHPVQHSHTDTAIFFLDLGLHPLPKCQRTVSRLPVVVQCQFLRNQKGGMLRG
ncbi:hypothetical protein V8E52_003619 [Russula decolorans]